MGGGEKGDVRVRCALIHVTYVAGMRCQTKMFHHAEAATNIDVAKGIVDGAVGMSEEGEDHDGSLLDLEIREQHQLSLGYWFRCVLPYHPSGTRDRSDRYIIFVGICIDFVESQAYLDVVVSSLERHGHVLSPLGMAAEGEVGGADVAPLLFAAVYHEPNRVHALAGWVRRKHIECNCYSCFLADGDEAVVWKQGPRESLLAWRMVESIYHRSMW